MNIYSRHAVRPAGYMLKLIGLQLELVDHWLKTFDTRARPGIRHARKTLHAHIEATDSLASRYIAYPRSVI